MSVTTRVVAAGIVLLAAAIPVGALSLKTSSDSDFTLKLPETSKNAAEGASATGTSASRTTTPADDCGVPCEPTGSIEITQLVPQNTVVEGNGLAPDVPGPGAVAKAPPAPTSTLVPQNPSFDAFDDLEPKVAAVTEEPEEAEEAEEAEAAPKETTAKPKPRRRRQAKKKGPASGSWQMLFEGPK